MKVGRIAWSGQAAVDLLKATNAAFVRVVSDPLPDDAEFVRAAIDEYGYIWLIVKSETFADVPEGEPIPALKRTAFAKAFS